MSTAPPSLRALDSPDSYTVAWIAALPVERAAAEAMLDEIHTTPEGFSKNHTDNNVYTWGRMGLHNIVIASLPAGVHGVTSAATTASNLLASLPSIRVGLLVGIGGGIARPDDDNGRDIRLGDVVVSQPDGTTGGVCQYDFVKAKQGGKLERKGFLSPPPGVLLNALSSIQARHMLEESKVTDFVQAMLNKYPKMGRKTSRGPGFTYQGTENDRLFQASYNHIPGSGCQGCDTAGEVQRGARDSTDPEIHYGIIASGNTLVKDAAARDKIVRDVGEDCLCFEMEAAGLMNAFPCLVIRGICDYADSHKNDKWQQYASATAAAYGKELLLYVPVSEVRETRRALDVLKLVDHKLDYLQQTTADFVSKITSESHANKIRSWLQPPDPSSNENQARKVRHKGTGTWLLEHSIFQTWCSGSRRCLWLHGVAGSGKTILSTTVLDHLNRNGDGCVLSFFYDFGDDKKQTLDGMLRSLAFQLYQSATNGAKRLDDLFKKHGDGGRKPSTKAVSDDVCEMLAISKVVYVVLDALDESITRRELLDWIADVASRPDLAHVRLLCTARPEAEFLARFNLLIGKESWISLDREAAVNTDIRAFVAGQLATRQEFQEKHLPLDLIEEIVTKVGDGADGMFRWAACQVDDLAECRSPRMIRDALQHLPRDLKKTYEIMLAKIPEGIKDDAMRLLHFLVHAQQPLWVEEAIEILATNTGTQQPGFDKDRRVFRENDLLYFCPGLVSIIEGARVLDGIEDLIGRRLPKALQLAHFSVKEYLRSLERFQPFKSSVAIAKTCMTYLRGASGNHGAIQNDYPFARLAAEIWTSHAASSQGFEEVFQESLAFIQEEETFRRWSYLHQARHRRYLPPAHPPPQGSRLYYACLVGLTRVAQELIRLGLDVNAESGQFNNALQAASLGGHYDLVKILLDEGADIHKKGGTYGNALQAASHKGHIGIVRLILERGADVNAIGGEYGTALSAASGNGDIDLWKLLVAQGADISIRGGCWGNTLQAASRFGHLEIVKLLIEMRMDVNTPGGKDSDEVALAAASDGGYTDIVKLLLANGSHVNVGNALWAASRQGHRHIAEQLLDKGAYIEGTIKGSTPMYVASEGGHVDTVRLLLDRGANAIRPSSSHSDTSEDASYQGGSDQVGALLGANTVFHSRDGHLDSALASAVRGDQLDIARLLLEKGADAKTLDGDALAGTFNSTGQGEMAKLLLERGADVNSQGGSALRAAVHKGQLEAVKNLLDLGAVIGDSLRAAIHAGHSEIAKLLLDRGADVETNTIRAAALRGNTNIVELLLEKRPDLDAQRGDLDGALQDAARNNHCGTAELLLEKGASIGGDTMEVAACRGHSNFVEWLLEKGANVTRDTVKVAAAGGYGNMLESLLERRPDLDAQNGDLDDALRFAVLHNHGKVVNLLLEKGANVNVNVGDAYGGNALQFASHIGYFNIAKLLLERGADVDAPSGKFGNALQAALLTHRRNIVELLLKGGARMLAEDYHRALHSALMKYDPDYVEFLVENGSALGANSSHHWSVLLEASEKGNTSLVRLALEKMTDFDVESGILKDALQAAHGRRFGDIVGLLLKRIAITTKNNGRVFLVALKIASERGLSDTVKLLLERVSDLAPQSAGLDEALQAAHEKGFKDIVEMLAERGATRI